MKKTPFAKKLRLSRQSVAVLGDDQLRATSGAMPDPFPPSWFRCGFTLWCND